jgi:hypothetical protein
VEVTQAWCAREGCTRGMYVAQRATVRAAGGRLTRGRPWSPWPPVRRSGPCLWCPACRPGMTGTGWRCSSACPRHKRRTTCRRGSRHFQLGTWCRLQALGGLAGVKQLLVISRGFVHAHCQTAEGVAIVQCSLAMLAQVDAALGCSRQYMQPLHSTYFMAVRAKYFVATHEGWLLSVLLRARYECQTICLLVESVPEYSTEPALSDAYQSRLLLAKFPGATPPDCSLKVLTGGHFLGVLLIKRPMLKLQAGTYSAPVWNYYHRWYSNARQHKRCSIPG